MYAWQETSRCLDSFQYKIEPIGECSRDNVVPQSSNIFLYASILCANDFYYKTNFPCILGVSQGLARQASFSCATDFRSCAIERRGYIQIPIVKLMKRTDPRYRHGYGINQKTKEIDGWTKSINFKRAPSLLSVKSFFESSYIRPLPSLSVNNAKKWFRKDESFDFKGGFVLIFHRVTFF